MKAQENDAENTDTNAVQGFIKLRDFHAGLYVGAFGPTETQLIYMMVMGLILTDNEIRLQIAYYIIKS